MDKMTFSEAINEERKKKKITIKQLSDMCGTSVSSMNRYLAAIGFTPLDIAVRMAKAVDVSLDKVFGLNHDGKYLANVFLMIADLMITQFDGQYAANYGNQGSKTIIITDIFHGAIDFEAWAKIAHLYRDGTITKEMYDAWIEKKSESL